MVQIKLSMRCIVLSMNLIFATAGLAILGVGAAMQVQGSLALDMLEGLFPVTPLLSIALGTVMFLVALLGCAGATLQNHTMIVTYTMLLAALIICEVALAVVIFVNVPRFESALLEALDNAFSAENKETFHALEAAFRCCGNRGPSSYVARPIPPSCCPSGYVLTCGYEEAYKNGCNDLIVNRLYGFASIVGSLIIATAALKVSLCLLPLTVKEGKLQNKEENETGTTNGTENKQIESS